MIERRRLPQPDTRNQNSQFSGPENFPIPEEHFHIRFHTGIEPTRAVEKVIAGADDFARRVSTHFGTRVLSWMDQISKEPYKINPRMYDHVKTHGLYTPTFDFYDSAAAGSFLDSLNLIEGERIDDNGLLMVFNLPKPLAHFWWLARSFEQGNDQPCKKWGEKAIVYDTELARENIDAGTFTPIPPWGDAYHGMREIFWNELEHKNVKSSFDFERIGERGTHDAAHFYYLLELFPSGSEFQTSGDIFTSGGKKTA